MDTFVAVVFNDEPQAFKGGEAIMIATWLEVKDSIFVCVFFKKRRDTFVKPAWQAVSEMGAVELVPAFMPEDRKCSLSSNIVCDADTLEIVCASFHFKIERGVIPSKCAGESFPLLAFCEKIYF